MEELKKEIEQIKERNKRVENDKARETSWARKVIIMVLTYGVIVIFFYAASINKPWINAIVPTIGFLLSTMSLSFLKNVRIKKYK
ncbi:MAG: hypothetical protein WCL02_04125 [bacterium]